MNDIRTEAHEDLDKKGTIEILIEMGCYRHRFSELHEVVDISASTLAKRLEEGIEDGLWKIKIEEQNMNVYNLTERGNRYFEMAEEVGLIEELREYRNTTDEFRSEKQSFYLSLRKNSDEIPTDDGN